jgi:hypothetical protein
MNKMSKESAEMKSTQPEGPTEPVEPLEANLEPVERTPEPASEPPGHYDQPLYNPNDGLHGRTGGPYLDQLELIEAEKKRAFVEGREPDFNNLQGSAGVRLVTAQELASANVTTTVSVPSSSNVAAATEMIEHLAHNPNIGPVPVWIPPVQEGTE